MSPRPVVGVVGLGNMGAPMCRALVSAGQHDVLVWGRRPASTEDAVAVGARAVPLPRDLGAEADVLVSVLPDLAQLEEVLDGPDGVLAGLGERGPDERDLVVVVCSTSDPEAVRRLAARLAETTDGRVHVVDAPVSGGVDGAERAALSIMVGGSPADVAQVEPVLRTFGTPRHLGPLGAGEVAKACNQMIVASTILALGEASVVAERAGIDLTALFDLLGAGYAGGRLLESRRERFERHDHAVSGPARFMVKDLGFAVAAARASGTSTVLTDHLLAVFTDLTDRGLGDQDITVTQAYVEAGAAPA